MLCSKITALYPELTELDYANVLDGFISREEARLETERACWLRLTDRRCTSGTPPKCHSTPLMRQAWQQLVQEWERERRERKPSYGINSEKINQLLAERDLIRWQEEGLRSRIYFYEDRSLRKKR